MGLSIAKNFDNTGITLIYWRINMVSVDIEANKTICRVGGYISKADALAGNRSIKSVVVELSGSNNPIGLMTDPREYQNLLYAKLIVPAEAFAPTNYFAGATIVSDLPNED